MVENKIPGFLTDSRGILAMMYINDRYKKHRKVAGIKRQYARFITVCSNIKLLMFDAGIQGVFRVWYMISIIWITIAWIFVQLGPAFTKGMRYS